MPKTYATRADAQLRTLFDVLDSTCLVCGSNLVLVVRGDIYLPECPDGPHAKAECDAAFARLQQIVSQAGGHEPPVAEEPTAIPPTNAVARADIYRQRVHAGQAIFHPGDLNESEALARVVGHTEKGTFFRGELVAESGEEEEDDAEAVIREAFDRADEIRVRWLAERGARFDSEAFQTIARRVCPDQEAAGAAPDADAGRLAS